MPGPSPIRHPTHRHVPGRRKAEIVYILVDSLGGKEGEGPEEAI